MSHPIKYFDPSPEDLARCIRAYRASTREFGELSGIYLEPAADLCRAWFNKDKKLRIELRNVNGILAVYTVGPKRVVPDPMMAGVLMEMEGVLADTDQIISEFGAGLPIGGSR